MTVWRFLISALGSLWLLAGILALAVAATTPRDPKGPPLPDLDAAQWVMLVWYSIAIVLLGPMGLSRAIDNRDERRRKIEADSRKARGV